MHLKLENKSIENRKLLRFITKMQKKKNNNQRNIYFINIFLCYNTSIYSQRNIKINQFQVREN